MGRARRGLVPGAAAGPKERHKRTQRSQYRNPYSPRHENFVAKPSLPKSKHHSYFELVENKEKKKKLEYQITTEKTPPPGFEFVPIGNPQLTAACKEISREKDAMIFIVSNAKGLDESSLANQVHRIGHHIRQVIVEEAKASIDDMPHLVGAVTGAGPEPIPESQSAYHAQVDAAIRDLFPRIPNTDRQMIIEHSFTRGSTNRSEHPVGFSEDIPLSRRVQLAVLAHIRHTHTRYDALLRETTWQNARRTVESLCLDILVKWRGDEETGRDQLDEILREVVVISDSEDDDDDEDEDDDDSTDYTSDEDADQARLTPMPVYRSAQPVRHIYQPDRSPPRSSVREAIQVFSPPAPNVVALGYPDRGRRVDRRAQRGFRRYRAWEEAIRRNRVETPVAGPPSLDTAISHAASYQPSRSIGPSYDVHVRPYDNSSPVVLPSGTSPSLNSRGIQRPIYEVPSSLTSSPYRGPPIDARPSHEKVMSVVPYSTSTSSRELAPSASSHFPDMLVRSIEPASPAAQSTYIRTLPPRSQVSVSSYATPVTPLAGFQHPPRLVSNPGEGIHPWDRPPATQVIYDGPHNAMDFNAISSRESNHSHDFRGQTYPHPTAYGAQPASSFPHPASGNPVSAPSSRLPETRRIVLNATRPGERSNPILMEDRGGYYERVNPRPEGSARIQLRPTRPAQPPAEVEVQTTVRPHTIFQWEEDSRHRAERRGVAEIEVNPLFDSRSRAPHAPAPHTHPYPPRDYYGAPRLEPLTKEPDYRVQTRQVPSGEYAAPPPEGYWVIRQYGDRQVPRPHPEPVYHPLPTRPSGVDERYDTRREHPGLGQPASNIIVID